MSKVGLTVPESIKYAEDGGWWDGFAAGVQAAAEAAKSRNLAQLIAAKQQQPKQEVPDVPVAGQDQ